MVLFGFIAIACGLLGLKTRHQSAKASVRMFFNFADDSRREAWERRFVLWNSALSGLIVTIGVLFVAVGTVTGDWLGNHD